MLDVKALLDGTPVSVSGTLVISPASQASLSIDGLIVEFDFKSVEGRSFDVEVSNKPFKTIVTFINLSTSGVSMDLEPFRFGKTNYRLALALMSIGDADPHRVMHYTFAEAA